MRQHDFLKHAWPAYLQAVRQPGHGYYLSYEKLLVIAEYIGANVVMVQRHVHSNAFQVLGRTTQAGTCAIVTLTNTGRGAVRGHCERLVADAK